MVNGFVRDGAVFRDNIELVALQRPPGVGDGAVGDEAVVQDILVFELIGILALK